MLEELPEYAVQPLRTFLEYWEDSRRLLDVSIEGMSALENVPGMLTIAQAIKSIVPRSMKSPDDQSDPAEDEAKLEKAQRNAEFAQKEIKTGFPLLHAHTLVGAWGALEAAIEDMLVGILMNESRHLQHKMFARIKLPLADFERLEKEERMRLLIELVNRDLPPKRNGIDMFEDLLDIFLLSGPINAETRKTLWRQTISGM